MHAGKVKRGWAPRRENDFAGLPAPQGTVLAGLRAPRPDMRDRYMWGAAPHPDMREGIYAGFHPAP